MKAMKLQIGDYEIEIKATDNALGKKKPMNEQDTLMFINTLAIAFSGERKYEESKGYDALAEESWKCQSQCHDFCEEHGYYKGL